jgi:hypothetical protein
MGRSLLIAGGAALIAWLAAHGLGWWAGIAIGISLCVAWLRFRRTSRIARLFTANLRCYCAARRVGESIDEAIQSMVRRRYRSSVEQQQALRLIAAVLTPDIEKIRVMQAVYVIFCLENGPPWHPDLRVRYTADLASCYERLMKRHGLPE